MPRAGALTRTLTTALADMGATAGDAVTVQLALTYARQIDAAPADNLARLGPQLLAVLDSLLMTPRARAALLPKGGSRDGAPRALDQLRAKRAARLDDAPPVDAPAS